MNHEPRSNCQRDADGHGYAGTIPANHTTMEVVMTRRSYAVLGAAALSLFVGTELAAQDARAAIETANRAFEGAVTKGDGAAMAALYTAQAQLLPFGSDVVSGTPAIAKFWQGVIDSGIAGGSLKTLEVEAHAGTAHEVGQYELKGKAGQVLDRGKYVVIWKQEGGRWKLHRDIWTSSMPPAKP